MTDETKAGLRELVAKRAGFICEYCLISEKDSYYKFQIEHIISRKHGGNDDAENLALACIFCNLYKGSDIASISPESGEIVRFFNPRTDRWNEHFRLSGVTIEPLTEIGEVTARILKFNHEDRLIERQFLARSQRYPTPEALLLIVEH